MTQKIDIKTSSGNVFADLDLPNPDKLLVKANLAKKITNAIQARNMTQTEAAKLLGIEQPKAGLFHSKKDGKMVEKSRHL